jgi:hypothetical protein
MEPHEPDYEKKIEALEDELKRKDKIIENLKERNKVLFRTAVKNTESSVDASLKAEQTTKQ